MSKNYFEIPYKGQMKGIYESLPEDVMPQDYSPFMNNFILKHGEIRTRPRQIIQVPPPDNTEIKIITSFIDANNVFHTVAVTTYGLWQLNLNWSNQLHKSKKAWNLIGPYPRRPCFNIPVTCATFINKFFWSNGCENLWYWDGITSVGAPKTWKEKTRFIHGEQILDSNGNLQVAGNSGFSKSGAHPVWSVVLGGQTTDSGTTPIIWTMNGKAPAAAGFSSAAIVDATNGVTSGAYFLIELNAQLLMCNTVETVGGNFPQRIRWCPSGLPFIWDPNVNIGAGYEDELDVPDAITGAFTVGTTAFILRTNGITEVTSNGGNAQNPFTFNHLWASDRGIGNVYPFGYASYGPLGIFISEDDIYNVSLGGFKKIGSDVKDLINDDLVKATRNPIASLVPFYQRNYIYHHYRLSIPQGNNNIWWNYCLEENSWQRESRSRCNTTAISRWSYLG